MISLVREGLDYYGRIKQANNKELSEKHFRTWKWSPPIMVFAWRNINWFVLPNLSSKWHLQVETRPKETLSALLWSSWTTGPSPSSSGHDLTDRKSGTRSYKQYLPICSNDIKL